MINCSRLMNLSSFIFFLSSIIWLISSVLLGFSLLKSLLSHLFIPLHHFFLLLSKLSLLISEVFHAHSFINGPWSLEITTGSITLLYPLSLELLPVSFSAHRWVLNIGINIQGLHCVWVHHLVATIVWWVQCMAKVLEVVVLFMKLPWIDVDLLNHTRQMVLFCD